jgi:N utilization substance protein A
MKGKEILTIAELLSNEHGLEKDVVFKAIEVALAISAKKDYETKGKYDLACKIDQKTGSYELHRKWTVVDDNEKNFDPAKHLYDDQAEEMFECEVEIGQVFTKFLEKDKPLSRISAQVFKNTIKEQVRLAIKLNAQEKYTDQVGEMFKVKVSKFTKGGDVFVSVNDTVEGIIKREGIQRKERFKIGQVLDVVLLEVVDNYKGQQLIFDRTSDAFVKGVIALEVPTVKDESVAIRGFARSRGRKTLVAVEACVPHTDPVAECIGARAVRVKSIKEKIGGEAIEFIPWDKEIESFIGNVFAGKAKSIFVDENEKETDVGMEQETLEGLRNRKVEEELTSKITGYTVTFYTEEELDKKQEVVFEYYLNLFKEKLMIEDDFAEALIEEGFDSFESLAYTSTEDYLDIEGFDEGIAEELQKRAKNVLQKDEEAKELLDFKTLYKDLIDTLNENEVSSIEDLANLSTFELKDILGLRTKEINAIIIEAKELFFA